MNKYDLNGYFSICNLQLLVCNLFVAASWADCYCEIKWNKWKKYTFFSGGVAMMLKHRYFIQKTLGTSTICSHGYGFDMP